MLFQTIGGNIIRDFEKLDDASRYFYNTTMSGDRCRLFGVTWHDQPGIDGKYCSTELLDERTA